MKMMKRRRARVPPNTMATNTPDLSFFFALWFSTEAGRRSGVGAPTDSSGESAAGTRLEFGHGMLVGGPQRPGFPGLHEDKGNLRKELGTGPDKRLFATEKSVRLVSCSRGTSPEKELFWRSRR